jgi:hypothetical protein
MRLEPLYTVTFTVYKRYQTTIRTDRRSYKVLRVEVEREEGKKSLVAQWEGITLARNKSAILDDQPYRTWNARTELIQRLLADRCELCGSRQSIQVHHVRALKDLERKGRSEMLRWAKEMAARRRKTLVVCRKCHTDIHAGKPPRATHQADATPESRMTRKCHVRIGGGRRKSAFTEATRRRPTQPASHGVGNAGRRRGGAQQRLPARSRFGREGRRGLRGGPAKPHRATLRVDRPLASRPRSVADRTPRGAFRGADAFLI